jgi:hypothetical protein
MGTMKATREQFVLLDDQEVRHEPTGARCGQVLDSGEEYELDDVKSMALEVLRDRALERAQG